MREEIKRMITIREASDLTGISYDFVRKLCLNGEIPHIRCGSKYLINQEQFLAYIDKKETESIQ